MDLASTVYYWSGDVVQDILKLLFFFHQVNQLWTKNAIHLNETFSRGEVKRHKHNKGYICFCETSSLQASSQGRSCGGVGKGRRACNYVSGIWIPPPISLWLPFDRTVRFPPISVSRVMTSWLMSSLLISLSHRLFKADIQISDT